MPIRSCITCQTSEADTDCLTCHGPEWLNWVACSEEEKRMDVIGQNGNTGIHYPDPNVESVRKRLADRAAVGLLKYGCDTTRSDLTRVEWLRHLQEELLDAAVYVERLIQDEIESSDA